MDTGTSLSLKIKSYSLLLVLRNTRHAAKEYPLKYFSQSRIVFRSEDSLRTIKSSCQVSKTLFITSNRFFHSKRFPFTSQTSSLADLRLIGEQLKQLQTQIVHRNLRLDNPINQKNIFFYLERSAKLAKQIRAILEKMQELSTVKKEPPPQCKSFVRYKSSSYDPDPQKVAVQLLSEAFHIGKSLLNMNSTLLSTSALNIFINLCQLTDKFEESKSILKLMSRRNIYPDLSTYRNLIKMCIFFEKVPQINAYFSIARKYFFRLYLRQVGLNMITELLAGIGAYLLHFSFFTPGMTAINAYAILCGLYLTGRFSMKLMLMNYSPYHTAYRGFGAFWALGFYFPKDTTQESIDNLYSQALLDSISLNKMHVFNELILHQKLLKVSLHGEFAEKAAEGLIKTGQLDLALYWVKRSSGKPSPPMLFYLAKSFYEKERFSDVAEILQAHDLGVFSNPPFAIETYFRLGQFRTALKISIASKTGDPTFLSENLKQSLCFLESHYFHSHSDQLFSARTPDYRLYIWAIKANRYNALNPLMSLYSQVAVDRILFYLNEYSRLFPRYPSRPHLDLFVEAIESLNSHKRYDVSLGIYYSTVRPYFCYSLKNGTLFLRTQELNQLRKAMYPTIVAACHLTNAHDTSNTPSTSPDSCCFVVSYKKEDGQGSIAAYSALLKILEDYKATLRPLEVIPPAIISLVSESHPSLNVSLNNKPTGANRQHELRGLLGRLHHISPNADKRNKP